jgi:hypothetical protein
VLEALEGASKTYDALLTDIETVDPHLLPIVVGEHTNP